MAPRDVRRRLEEREESLSPHAARSRLSRGRERAEAPSPLRTDFQRDRDRILHSMAFRRLKHKTQVFIAPQGDHFVTRLTHTLEVSQIARTMARALNLNEDLAEAISLGHDLGHTPFGHAGEEALAAVVPGGFRHAEQSLRVVDCLEGDGAGLNLTWEVRQGILHHSKSRYDILEEGVGRDDPGTLEGQLCRLADSIAYINHDLADALRAGLITERDVPQAVVAVLGSTSSRRINTLVTDMVEQSWGCAGLEPAASPRVAMSAPIHEAANALREFLFQRVYESPSILQESRRAQEVVQALYRHFLNPEPPLPPEYGRRGEPRARQAADYIAGMTDNFAQRLFQERLRGGWVV
ncbi:MAG: deoxyguanosinetriphosphate triphosphohydrolase [Chloroflexi bacterium]|nr:deoxyguanosinetriphosphate triphosphohydrolase [Chloroflexota bacterium]